jgi:ABC-type transporter Mla MlaB component
MTTRKPKTPVRKSPRRPGKRGPSRADQAAPCKRTAAARAGVPRPALGEQCTLAEAESLKGALIRLLEEPRPVVVEIAALRRVDTAGLQLLAAFVRDRRAAGRQVEWRGRAPALDAAAAVLDLRDLLELAAGNGR